MNDEAFARFETEAAEILGALKHLFREFERQLGEAVSAQRLASSEARNEAADVRALLRKLAKRAEETADGQRQALEMLRENWWFNIEENAKASGAEMALTFGEKIAEGLEKRLKVLGGRVDHVVKQFHWVTVAKWGTGIGIGIALTIWIAVSALTPHVSGLTDLEMRSALAELIPCQVDQERHVCIRLDDKPRFAKSPGGPPIAVVRGL